MQNLLLLAMAVMIGMTVRMLTRPAARTSCQSCGGKKTNPGDVCTHCGHGRVLREEEDSFVDFLPKLQNKSAVFSMTRKAMPVGIGFALLGLVVILVPLFYLDSEKQDLDRRNHILDQKIEALKVTEGNGAYPLSLQESEDLRVRRKAFSEKSDSFTGWFFIPGAIVGLLGSALVLVGVQSSPSNLKLRVVCLKCKKSNQLYPNESETILNQGYFFCSGCGVKLAQKAVPNGR